MMRTKILAKLNITDEAKVALLDSEPATMLQDEGIMSHKRGAVALAAAALALEAGEALIQREVEERIGLTRHYTHAGLLILASRKLVDRQHATDRFIHYRAATPLLAAALQPLEFAALQTAIVKVAHNS